MSGINIGHLQQSNLRPVDSGPSSPADLQARAFQRPGGQLPMRNAVMQVQVSVLDKLMGSMQSGNTAQTSMVSLPPSSNSLFSQGAFNSSFLNSLGTAAPMSAPVMSGPMAPPSPFAGGADTCVHPNAMDPNSAFVVKANRDVAAFGAQLTQALQQVLTAVLDALPR